MTETSEQRNARLDEIIDAGIAAAKTADHPHDRARKVALVIRDIDDIDARLIAVALITKMSILQEQIDEMVNALRDVAPRLGLPMDEFDQMLAEVMGSAR